MAGSTSKTPGRESRAYPSRPFIAASVAVFRDGKVLLAARTKPPSPALFSLPGGLVEVGETLEQAALRELMEEVGVEAEILGFAGHVEVIERDPDERVRSHFVVNAFAGRWLAGEPVTGTEASDVRFVAPAEVGSLATTPGLTRILDRAASIVGRRA
jgi:ADP-ribose pyrophosphatase YjhB (NUDIX family)